MRKFDGGGVLGGGTGKSQHRDMYDRVVFVGRHLNPKGTRCPQSSVSLVMITTKLHFSFICRFLRSTK